MSGNILDQKRISKIIVEEKIKLLIEQSNISDIDSLFNTLSWCWVPVAQP